MSWNVSPTRADIVVLNTYLTNWRTSNQVSCLAITTSAASRNHKQLLGITLQNVCSTSITLTQLTPTWTQANNRVTQIQINGTVVWSSGGIGSPSGTQFSGTVLTLSPYSIVNNSAVIPLDLLQMTGNIKANENWALTFTMADNSTNTVNFITP